ncbi:GntT/GntP/DsdX family permease [Weissella cibaria]|uniref:GntT/GntP/DsdX family permease n=1 Tax=Weissella cibaria TaxID=137591 RepID=UPI0021AE6B2B|nr:thiamine pyrophosphate-binding protein [Weissella cibaria]
MSDKKITAGLAALKVMEGWGIDTMYGIPSGTLSGLMNAMSNPENNIKFIQVKHEEVGSMAAAMQYKFSGKMAVAVGSGGPGATHLINGLYDAAMDATPVLAILGSKPSRELGMDSFQELNQNPMYNNIAVYNKRVAVPEQLPYMIDDAIRTAISKKGVAVLEVPAGLTTAGIVAPLVANQTAVNPAFVVLAIGAGSLAASHVNDAGFWMFKEFFDLDVPQTLKIWTVLETIISVVGLIVILILSAIFS